MQELDYKESWVPKNWCFWTMVLEKTLESPLDARRSNQSLLKEINPEYSLEGLMPKLELQYFGHWRVNSLRRLWCWERWKAWREGDGRRWDGWMASLTQWTGFGWTLGVGDGQGGLACRGSWDRKESDMTERLNWTELIRMRADCQWNQPCD